MPVDPHRMAAAVVAQQREIAGALFRDQNVAIRQHQQTSRVDEAGRERRCREAGRHLRGLSGVSDNERPVAHDRSCLRRRQSGRIDAEPPADLVFGKKILLQRVMLRVLLNAGLRARQASLPIDPPKRKRCNGKCSAPHKYETDDHGSEISHRAGSPLQNHAEPTGYKVVRVPFKDGRPEGYYENFITGFWVSGERARKCGDGPRRLRSARRRVARRRRHRRHNLAYRLYGPARRSTKGRAQKRRPQVNAHRVTVRHAIVQRGWIVQGRRHAHKLPWVDAVKS